MPTPTTSYSPTFIELGFRSGTVLPKKIFSLFHNQKDQWEKVDILYMKQVLRSFINNSSHLLRECFAQYKR